MYAKLLARMCDLIAPLVWNLCPSKRIVAEFKEFERRFKFKPRLKYGWFHL